MLFVLLMVLCCHCNCNTETVIFMNMQVHITQGDHVGRGVIISWVTPLERHPNVVTYWEDGKQDEKHKIHSITTFYRYYNYSSGYIHHATIKKVNEEYTPFKPYMHRYHVPYRASQSTSPLWYSIKRASAYIIVLSSYSAYGKYTPQYKWLKQELSKVNRAETPLLNYSRSLSVV
ncbi:unnamed protein product [Ilex paraguariensis]|uniref:Purple acid phosphatase N-terminal domain-containing protein n=1 Tax=Ilex paraguariensis TaxID=185542 RepID=A0ABC8TGW0_9AQUA